jgi:hypothetical protein
VEGASIVILRGNGKLVKEEKARKNHLELVPIILCGFPFWLLGMRVKYIREIGRMYFLRPAILKPQQE